jgi:CDP-diglyceride synthetase
MFIHIFRTRKQNEKNRYKKINEIIYASLTFFFGLYYPLIILKLGEKREGLIFSNAVDEMTLLGNVFIVGVMFIIFLWALSAKIRTLKNPELLKEQYNYEKFCKKLLAEYQIKNHMKRKITHILPGAVVGINVIIFYYFFRSLLRNAWIDYALFITIIIGIDFALTFIGEDLIRLYDFSFMPPLGIRLCNAGLNPEELDSFSSTSVMVFAFGPFIFLTFPIFFIVVMITSVADAMAYLFGTIASKNKHFFPKNTKKTIEGYVGGFTFSFLSIIFGISFSNFYGLSNWSIHLTLFLALTISITFFIVDLITSKIKLQDNYMNPIITGLTLIVILNYLNIPIF